MDYELEIEDMGKDEILKEFIRKMVDDDVRLSNPTEKLKRRLVKEKLKSAV
jgi:hypothetical protein